MGNFLLRQFLPLLGAPIVGFLTKYGVDFVDDVLKWTAKWPNAAKQAAVIAVASLLAAANQQWGLSLPTDVTQYTNPAVITAVIGTAVAFFLKHAE